MSDIPEGPGWWIASDGRWYSPERHPDYDTADPARVTPPTDDVPTSDLSTPDDPTTESAIQDPTTAVAPVEETTEQVTTGRRSRVLVPVVAVVVLGLVGALGFSFLRGSSGSATGASSPDEAVTELIGALAVGDGLGVLSSLDPVEIQPFIDVSEAFGTALEGSISETDLPAQLSAFDDLLPADTDLIGLLDGLEFHVGGIDGGKLSVSSTPIPDDPDLARVTFDSLEISVTLNGAPTRAISLLDSADPTDWYTTTSFSLAEVSVGTRAAVQLTSVGDDKTHVGVDALGTEFFDDEIPLRLALMTVRRDGRWYVSIGSTALDQTVAALDLDEPDYGAWRRLLDDPSAGSAAPEDILGDGIDDLNVADFDGVMSLIDPDGDRLLHSIWSVARNEVPDDFEEDSRLAINDLQTRLESNGSSHRLLFDRADLIDGDGGRFVLDGWCIQQDDGDTDCIEDQRALDLLPDAPFVAVVEHDGRWFFSLTGTYRAWADHAVDVLSDSDVLQELIDDSVEALTDGFDSEFEESAGFSPDDIESLLDTFGPIVASDVLIGDGTTTVTSGEEVVVASIAFPHVGAYDLDPNAAAAPKSSAELATDQLESAAFAVIEVEAAEPIELALGSAWFGPNQTDDGHLVGLVVVSADVLRTVPVTVFATPGKAVEVTITVTPIEPVLFDAVGTKSIELDENGLGVAVVGIEDFVSHDIVDGFASEPRYFGAPGGDVFIAEFEGTTTGDTFGLQWIGIEGDPNQTVTVVVGR